MNILIASNYDILFWGILILSAMFALFRGGVNELISLAVWIVALTSFSSIMPIVSHHLMHTVTNPLIKSVASFVIVFIILAIIGTIIKKCCSSIISNIGLGGLDRLLGLLFGILRGILICSVLVILINLLHLDNMHEYKNAYLYPVLHPVITYIANAISHGIHV